MKNKPFDVICFFIKDEAISLVPMARNCDWSRKIRPLLKLTQLAPRGMKTYSETRLELRNLRMLRKMLEKSSQFLSSEQPCEPKSLDVALNVAGVKRCNL